MARVLPAGAALPTTVIAGNDQCAVGLLDSFRIAGIDVPQWISEIGYDDSRLARIAHVGFATDRQDTRKGDAPPHTVVLRRFGVETLTTLVAESGMEGPVFTNRDGGWTSLANMRRAQRAALPKDLAWVTPHSFRRSVATVVRDAHGPALAQQQLSHAKLATTEAHYLQRQTRGPDVRAALERFATGESGD